MNQSKYNHSKSVTHETLDKSNLRSYIILKPNIDKNDEIVKIFIKIYNKNYERCSVSCVLKLLTTENYVRYIRNETKFNLDYFFNLSRNSILSRINQD